MWTTFSRAAEALLWPLGIRRQRSRREPAGEEHGEENSGKWEVDPCRFVGAVAGAAVMWWAMGKLKTSAVSPPLAPLEASARGSQNLGSGTTASSTILPRLPLSEFLRLLRTGAVTAVTYLADRPPAGALLVKARAAPMLAPQSVETLLLPGCHQGVFEELRAVEGVLFECADAAADVSEDMSKLSLLIDAGGLLASVAALAYMLRSNGQGSGSFTGQRIEDQAPETRSSVTFEDVAGMENTKEELREVISFLRNPDSFYALGAKPPRGILLAGPSGTGKTLLARAVAGEAGVPFLYASSAAFVEIYVGQGAQRIRQFFEQARGCAPCIVFLDELDAVGSSRQHGAGGHQEYAQTLNQLLLELDGIESHGASNSGIGTEGASGTSTSSRTVVTIAATNRYDCLDEALVRPGRLDRIVTVRLPNLAERTATLEIHARKLRTEGLNFQALARRTAGSSGAELANLLNEAALLAARRGSDAVRIEHVEQVLQNPRPQQQEQKEARARASESGGMPSDMSAKVASAAESPEMWAHMLAALAASMRTSTEGNDGFGRAPGPFAEEVDAQLD